MAVPFVSVTIIREEIRQHLKSLGTITARSEGYYDGTWYRNEYKLNDLDILHEFEAPDLLEATTAFTLLKPLLVLYTTERTVEGGTVDKRWYTVEFQLAVNFEPDGMVTLLGYLELLRVIVNPRDKSYWLKIGLAPREVTIGPIFNGSEIKDTLKDRLLVLSLVCEFSQIGAE
jgi:hypothetical protein